MDKLKFDWSLLRRERGTIAAEKHSAPAGSVIDGSEGGDSTHSGRDAPNAPVPLRVNDLKQYAYCPRIVFYQYTMPVERVATFKMDHGRQIEPRLEHLEHRRTLHRYGLGNGTRLFQVWLRSERLQLSGRLDLLITTPDARFPVDFKETLGPVYHNLRVQLCAYAMLLEDTYGGQVPTGFIYRVPRNDVVTVEMSDALRTETLAAISAIADMIRDERMPPPTPMRGRCTDCEYRNYCGDVF